MAAFHERGRPDSSAASSSSSSSSVQSTYDVFVSYRGEDSKNFSGYLINNLRQKGLTVFRDDEFERGEFLAPAFDSAIEGARASIIVFSENYADSKWCLNELVKIMDCRDLNRQLVRPIFYKVDPTVVRNQREKYGEAMAVHESPLSNQLEKVEKWRDALRTAANLSGWEFSGGYEPDFVQKITKEISTQIVNRASLHVAEHPVGLTARVSELNSILDAAVDRNDIRLVVVHGPQGIGKTTLAKAAYNSNLHHFEGSSFLANVGENSTQDSGILHLQNTLLHEILRENTIQIGNVDKGITLIKKSLHSKRVLVVFDDVNSLKELQSLAQSSDWFGKGSRIIVTTRDKNELDFHGFPFRSNYEVKKLDDSEALKLLCWNVFKKEEAPYGFIERAEHAVQCAAGSPFKLIELGSFLRKKLKDEWNTALESFKRDENQKAKGKNIVSLPGHYNHQSWEKSEVPSSSSITNSLHEDLTKNENVLISQDNNGKLYCMLSAKQLSIVHVNDPQKWSWIPNSRFSNVAKLKKVYWLEIKGKMETRNLSSETTYTVYFVYKFEGSISGFKNRVVKMKIKDERGEGVGEQTVVLDPSKNSVRDDEWMELKMGELFVHGDGDGEIKFRLDDHDTTVKKSGLVIAGVEFRPT